MNIRSVTIFYPPGITEVTAPLPNLAQFAKTTVRILQQKGYPVQSIRLATPPFATWTLSLDPDDLLVQIADLEKQALANDFNYTSIGPAHPNILESYPVVPRILAETKTIFVTGLMTASAGRVCLPAVRACGEIIAKTAAISPDGFDNLRFAALANVPPGSPFLPSAYHVKGQQPAVALAVESADLALEVFQNARSLEKARGNLIRQLEQHGAALQQALEEPCEQFGIQFLGVDYSMAPYPSKDCSSGAALESLGLTRLGLSGTLAAAAFLADTLDRGSWQRTGFNGLMLPVLEDTTLAARAADGSLTVRDLVMVSAVCGTGLDTIPLPGDANAGQLSAILLDIAVLSQRLDKPLTARLMPIPGKKAGDVTEFNFEYFAPSRVMSLNAEPLTGLLAGDELIDFQPRHRSQHL